jgi:5-(carboxyamino)imidazole ribonucleotide synthase
MMHAPATALGIRLRVLAEADDVAAARVVPDSPVGDYRDESDIRSFADGCDLVTFDHEHVPTDLLRSLEAGRITVRPGPAALVHAQDKLVMRRALTGAGVPCPGWAHIRTTDDLDGFTDRVGWPVVLKTARGGYDGKGVVVVASRPEAVEWHSALSRTGSQILAEEYVPFERELAVLVARSPTGQAAAWPVVETVQVDGICREVIAPAPGLDSPVAAEAVRIGLRVAEDLDVVGVLAVEMFQRPPGGSGPGLVVNELAMRPHNSGHWTIDGAVTSQFEQHLRAVLDLPLGDPRPRQPWTVMVNVLGGDRPDLYPAYAHVMARDPAVKVHMYGKSVRPGRKIGHVTAFGDDLDDCRARARHAAEFIAGTIEE